MEMIQIRSDSDNSGSAYDGLDDNSDSDALERESNTNNLAIQYVGFPTKVPDLGTFSNSISYSLNFTEFISRFEIQSHGLNLPKIYVRKTPGNIF